MFADTYFSFWFFLFFSFPAVSFIFAKGDSGICK